LRACCWDKPTKPGREVNKMKNIYKLKMYLSNCLPSTHVR
jgi:hypothetical protein